MARTGESGSWWAERKRATTASSDGLDANEISCVNSGNPRDRSMPVAPFLCYCTTKRVAGTSSSPGSRTDSVAHELVTLERRGNLVGQRSGVWRRIHTLGAQHLADAAQVYGLGPIVIERDDVFDGAAQIRFPLGCEQDSTGADVP